MKLHFTILVLLITVSIYCESQIREETVGRDYREGLNPVDEIPLFNKEEIKKKGFKTAYIVYHPPSWDGDYCSCSYNDTITTYHFDREGRISDKTQMTWLGMYGAVVWFDTLGNWTKRVNLRKKEGKIVKSDTFYYNLKPDSNSRYQVIREKIGEDSIITSIYFEKFKTGFDTAIVNTNYYNPEGKLIEEKSYSTEKYKRLNDEAGSFDYKYGYDSMGRLIYYMSVGAYYYSRIFYPPYGKLTETIDVRTEKLIDSDVKRIDISQSRIILTDGRSQIFLIRLEKNSKLYKLKSVTSYDSDIPYIEYYEIIYQ